MLRPGGLLLFSVWDRIDENEFADVVNTAVAALFPRDSPSFLRRIPHGYFDRAAIERDLRIGGFTNSAHVETMAARSRSESPVIPAIAYCQGTPLRTEIEARDASRLADATRVAAEAIGRRFGNGPVDGKVQAHIVSVSR